MKRWLCSLVMASLLLSGAYASARDTDFSVRAINGQYQGKMIGLRTFKGKVIYLAFFATWCKPCLSELKHLRKLQAKYADKGLIVLGVSVDEPQTRSRVLPTIKRYKIDYPVAIDTDSQVVRLYNPKRATPFSLLFSRDGKVLSRRSTFQASDLPDIEKEIVRALDKK